MVALCQMELEHASHVGNRVLLEDYNKKIDKEEWRIEARKTVILAFKAIDAYEKALDDGE